MHVWVLRGLVLLGLCASASASELEQFVLAQDNARQAAEALGRCHRFVEGWLKHRDAETGLIPQNLNSPVWTPENSAADNYPFMVLSCFWTDREMLDGVMRDILDAEIRYTTRVRSLPDAFNLDRDGFERPAVDRARLIFGAAEYCKDGLLPVTEMMGRDTPWYERLHQMARDIGRCGDRLRPHPGRWRGGQRRAAAGAQPAVPRHPRAAAAGHGDTHRGRLLPRGAATEQLAPVPPLELRRAQADRCAAAAH
jgi:hypothetical protein